MSTTRELVQAFRAKRPPEAVQTVRAVPASYCWRLDVTGVSHWIGQVNDAELLAALRPAIENEDQGEIVGTLAKVRPNGKTLAYGPVELRSKPWQRLQALTNVAIGNQP